MDSTAYVQEALCQLQDKSYYIPLEKTLFVETADLISDILKTLQEQKWLTKKQVSYLKGESAPSPRCFYLLPKFHKPPET